MYKIKKAKFFNRAIFMAVISFCALMVTACSQEKARGQGRGEPVPDIDLHTAVITDNLEVVNQHIRAGSDLNVKDPFGGSSPLISAAVFGKTRIAKVLLDAGVDINFQNNDGSTALHSAAFFCRPDIVRLLIDKKADRTIRNKYGATAYDIVAGPFSDMKDAYDMMGQVLAPMGLELDYPYLEKTRPKIAAMLK